MNKPHIYEIRIEDLLSDRWSDWFEGLQIETQPNHETIIRGLLLDQAAMLGVLAKIHALNLTIASVKKFPPDASHDP